MTRVARSVLIFAAATILSFGLGVVALGIAGGLSDFRASLVSFLVLSPVSHLMMLALIFGSYVINPHLRAATVFFRMVIAVPLVLISIWGVNEFLTAASGNSGGAVGVVLSCSAVTGVLHARALTIGRWSRRSATDTQSTDAESPRVRESL